jgi:hypothetical protein
MIEKNVIIIAGFENTLEKVVLFSSDEESQNLASEFKKNEKINPQILFSSQNSSNFLLDPSTIIKGSNQLQKY